MKTVLFLMLATAVFAAEAPLLKDDFLLPDFAGRRALRGEWKGHVFRLVFTPNGMGVRAFPPEEKDHKSISLGNEAAVKLKTDGWSMVSVELRGSKATVKVGEFTKTYEHASIARAKVNLSVGFSYGTVNVTELVVNK